MLSIVIPIHTEEPSILPLYDRLNLGRLFPSCRTEGVVQKSHSRNLPAISRLLGSNLPERRFRPMSEMEVADYTATGPRRTSRDWMSVA